VNCAWYGMGNGAVLMHATLHASLLAPHLDYDACIGHRPSWFGSAPGLPPRDSSRFARPRTNCIGFAWVAFALCGVLVCPRGPRAIWQNQWNSKIGYWSIFLPGRRGPSYARYSHWSFFWKFHSNTS